VEEEYKTINEIMPICIKDIESKFKNKNTDLGVLSGLADLDSIKTGFRKQELTIIASRPGVGKTSLALSIARNASFDGKKVLYITFEMSEKKIVDRMLCQTSKLNTMYLDLGLIKPSDFNALMEGAGKLFNGSIYIKTIYNKSIVDIHSLIKEAREKFEVDIVFVDYLTMIKAETAYQNRWEQVAETSRCLKQYAVEFDIPIVALCPINRYSIGKIPAIQDLSESGSLEYDSDCVIIITDGSRDSRSNETAAVVNEMGLIIAKNRNGPTGYVRAVFLPAYGAFEDIEKKNRTTKKK